MMRILYPLLIAALSACAPAPERAAMQGNYYSPRWARGFCIDTIDGEKVLHVASPFQSKEKQNYRYPLGRQPLERLVCMSTTHLGMLDFIGRADAIVGISAAQYVYNPALQAAYSAGTIAEVGYDANLDLERIAALKPDAVLAYGIYNEFEQAASKLAEIGIRTIYIGEYVEPHPLGKAEWAVALGAMLGCEDTAIARFQQVEEEYLALANLITDSVHPTPCLLNAPWNDAWFMPCQASNMAQFIADAGGASIIPLRANCDAFPESIERVFALSQGALVWLNAGNASTLKELSQMHKLIAAMPVFNNGNVYTHNRRRSPLGGSDFFESAAAMPHLVLRDLICILHPEVLGECGLYYYQRIE